MTVAEQLKLILLEEWDSKPSELQLHISLNPDVSRIERALVRAYNLGTVNKASVPIPTTGQLLTNIAEEAGKVAKIINETGLTKTE